jgi:hypothetical protein
VASKNNLEPFAVGAHIKVNLNHGNPEIGVIKAVIAKRTEFISMLRSNTTGQLL